ncbi:hypothetical protein [Bradyrhizobium sp. CCBAU 53415]|uniref:hypothetical protein n=1 Tax=Bradyrhizobium sp. CCBAU 53415 TaxID=1325119 RepID=UPI00230639ED|nr:hypothetical protein [Bradyrhizobium sp. CCBAU 53415]MDA9464732.1 hypothetical protein [Bradyrhizobium sp. CCBAU 53415]
MLYMISDTAEDLLAAAIIKTWGQLTDRSYSLLRKLTAFKIVAVGVAIGQVEFLGAEIVLLSVFPG